MKDSEQMDLLGDPEPGRLTLSLPGSRNRARTSQSPGKEQELPGKGQDSGQKLPVLSGSYDQNSSFSKMYPVCSLVTRTHGSANAGMSEPKEEHTNSRAEENYRLFLSARIAAGLWTTQQQDIFETHGMEPYCETWPRSGVMKSNGIAYQLPVLVPLTAETGGGVWPTPTVDGNYNRKGLSKKSGDGLATAVKMWPTPDTQNHRDGSKMRKDNNLDQGGRHGVSLHHAVHHTEKMWPTPTSRDYKDGSAKSCANVPENGLLGREVHQPPLQNSWKGARLSVTFVEWLMGYPQGWTDLKD